MRQCTKRIFCCAGAVLLCMGMLTGCGSKKKKQEKPLTGYAYKSRCQQINSWSKSIYTAAQAAITDLDAEDRDISSFVGDFKWSGSDFKEQNPNGSVEELLRYRMSLYFTDIVKMQDVYIEFDEYSIVRGVAVKRTYQRTGQVFYGTYPQVETVEIQEKLNSTEDALYYAVNGELPS